MSKVESFKIEMQPFMKGGDPWYEIQVRVNGRYVSLSRVIAEEYAHEAEIEMLTRMGTEIIRNLRNEAEHSGCCNCCEKKKCQKY